MFDPKQFIRETVKDLQATIKARRVVCGVSGGVDSTTLAALLRRAVNARVKLLLIETGLFRTREVPEIVKAFGQTGVQIDVIDRKERLLSLLAGVFDPEKKKTIIGKFYVDVFEEECKRFGTNVLAQGTIRFDVVESLGAQGGGDRITRPMVKRHSNVGAMPATKLEVVEPLKTLFKDEVRLVARELKLPESIIERQPFPGPGLAIRVMGEVTLRKLDVVREADEIVRNEMKKHDLQYKFWHFAAMTLDKITGIKEPPVYFGDTIAIRIVNTQDGLHAEWVKLDYEILQKMSDEILKVSSVTRVLYDITSKPPGTICYE